MAPCPDTESNIAWMPSSNPRVPMCNRTCAVMSLPDAAKALRKSWQQAYRLVLVGELDARRVEGRYVVSTASVELLKRHLAQEQAATQRNT